MPQVAAVGVSVEALGAAPLHDGGIVGVRDDRALRAHGVRVPDHGEERLAPAAAVDDPVGVEDLVPTVLGVRLREHGELGVRRITADRAVSAFEVLDLLVAERKPEPGVLFLQAATGYRSQRARRHMREEPRHVVVGAEHGLRHAIVQQRCNAAGFGLDVVGDAALDALDRAEPAVLRDVGRLRGPWRDRAQARHDQVERAARLGRRRSIVKQALEQRALRRAQLGVELDEVAEFGADGAERGVDLLQLCDEFGEAELGGRTRPPELEDLGH